MSNITILNCNCKINPDECLLLPVSPSHVCICIYNQQQQCKQAEHECTCTNKMQDQCRANANDHYCICTNYSNKKCRACKCLCNTRYTDECVSQQYHQCNCLHKFIGYDCLSTNGKHRCSCVKNADNCLADEYTKINQHGDPHSCVCQFGKKCLSKHHCQCLIAPDKCKINYFHYCICNKGTQYKCISTKHISQ